ncbi:MAG: hypothetical protein ACLPYS_09710 [Vulcanimicrobiaceae bacterium]|jgi:hypothetical protein
MGLIDVRVNEATYYKLDQPCPVVLFKIAKSASLGDWDKKHERAKAKRRPRAFTF